MLSLSMTVLGMSGGGGDLGYGQTCDALNLCPENPLRGVMIPTCALGMHYVGAPQITVVDPLLRRESPRNPLFTLRTADTLPAAAHAASDPSTYAPGELITLHLRITKRFTESRRSWNGVAGMFACWPMVGEFAHGFVSICGESHNVRTGTAFAPGQLCPFDVDGADPTQRLSTCAAPVRNYSTTGSCACCGPTPQCRLPHPWEPQISGNEIQAWETSKYIGLLLYAVDENETKVGGWEIVPESPPRFWTPPDPGCDGKALMHRDVRLKRFHDTFHWRAPDTPLGSGVTFRALIKHGYTNGGAFFWPLSPSMPGGMRSKHDLALTEIAATPNAARWFRAAAPRMTCDEICAANGGRTCDAAALSSAGADPALLLGAIERRVLCKQPMLATCDADAPSIANSGSAQCWYLNTDAARCPANAAGSLCGTRSSAARRRLCPCGASRRRRRRLADSDEKTEATNAAAAASSSASLTNGAVAFSRGTPLVSVVVAISVAAYAGGAVPALLAIAVLLPTARAHNWIQKPSSRAKQASTIIPCPAQLGSTPNVQLNPGESFPIEWRVGHPGRRTFFTIVRAEDEQMLRTATKSVLDDYLNLAPEAAFAISGATTSPGVTCGRSRAATCSACSVGQCGGECKLITGVCSRDPDEVYAIANPLWSDGNYFLEEKYDKKFVSTCGSNCARKQACGNDEGPVRGTMLSKTDGRNIKRPEPYNCDDGASSPTRHRSSTTIGHGCRECEIDQWVYFDEKLKRDTRAAYNSSKYPWIVSVQGYFISSPGPHDVGFDISTTRIPAAVGAGNFIMHYQFEGYYDCVDIAVLPPVAVPPLNIAMRPAIATSSDYSRFAYPDDEAGERPFSRVDHCQFVRRTLGKRNYGTTLATSAAYVAAEFKDKCTGASDMSCDALHGTMFWPPTKNLGRGRTKSECMSQCAGENQPRYSITTLDSNGQGFCRCYGWSASTVNWLSGPWIGVPNGASYESVGLSSCGIEVQQSAYGACIAIPPTGSRNSLNQTAHEALDACKARGRNMKADGLNVVPIVAPPLAQLGVADSSIPSTYYNSDPATMNVAEGMNIPWGIGNCKTSCLSNEPPGSKVCYPLFIYGKRANAELDWQLAPEDVEDPIFYSTCYIANAKRKFDNATCPSNQCVNKVNSEWRFGNSCISCADTSFNADASVVPHWIVAPVEDCVECFAPLQDGPTFELPPPDQPESGWASADGGVTMTWVRAVGTRDAYAFELTCAGCTGDDGWIAVGITQPGLGSAGMIGVHAVRWNLEDGSVRELMITAKSVGGIALVDTAANNLIDVETDVEKRILRFVASRIGDYTIAPFGTTDQMWAYAYKEAGGWSSVAHDVRGTATFSFAGLERNDSALPRPTTPPTFDPDHLPTYKPTVAPTIEVTTTMPPFADLTTAPTATPTSTAPTTSVLVNDRSSAIDGENTESVPLIVASAVVAVLVAICVIGVALFIVIVLITYRQKQQQDSHSDNDGVTLGVELSSTDVATSAERRGVMPKPVSLSSFRRPETMNPLAEHSAEISEARFCGGSHDGGGEIPETKEVVVGSSKEIEVFHSEQRMSKQVDILHL